MNDQKAPKPEDCVEVCTVQSVQFIERFIMNQTRGKIDDDIIIKNFATLVVVAELKKKITNAIGQMLGSSMS